MAARLGTGSYRSLALPDVYQCKDYGCRNVARYGTRKQHDTNASSVSGFFPVTLSRDRELDKQPDNHVPS